jgi:leader peptidase (prepilin peptidase)/N-methyltransferase
MQELSFTREVPFGYVFMAVPAFYIGCCALLGLVIGSFLNVVIYRLPQMLDRQWRAQCAELGGQSAVEGTEAATKFNLLTPRSSCPSCKTPIKAWHNIPVVSWLLLKGRCSSCKARISARYPLVEALTAALFAIVAWKFGFGWPALAALVLTAFLVALTFIDVDHQLLPDMLTLPLLWIGIVLSLWSPEPVRAMPMDLRTSIIGAVAGYMSLWSVYHLFRLLTGKEGMGYGDFKLLAALGAWLGWQMLLPIVLVAAVVAAVVGIVIVSARRQERSTPIAFGPFLAAAGWIMLVWGPEILDRYFRFLGAGS